MRSTWGWSRLHRTYENESGFRPLPCTNGLNWARRTSWGWWDDTPVNAKHLYNICTMLDQRRWADGVIQMFCVCWDCPPDTGFEIQTLEVWGRARYPSVTEAPHNTEFYEWMGKKHFCFIQAAETGIRTPNSSVKGSGANHPIGPPP